MRIVDAGYEILDPLNGEEILKKIERVARVCYKSEDKITEGSAEKMVRALIKSNHMAMLEHYSFSVKFICDRGVSHEIVRHRVASYAQESTRYCNYSKGNVGDVTFIRPCFFTENSVEMDNWVDSCMKAEQLYKDFILIGRTPQEARSILPNSLKTEVVMTANLREWRHFLSLRACGSTGKPHPQMLEVAVPLLKELRERVPVVFDDLEPMELENRQKAGAGGVDTVAGLIKTSERRQSIRSVRGGVEHGSRIIKAGIYSLYHSGSRTIGSRYTLV